MYNKGFDLTSLPNGEYYFELDKDIEVQVIPFQVKMNKVEFLKEKETKFFKPIIRFKDNKILLTSRITSYNVCYTKLLRITCKRNNKIKIIDVHSQFL